MIPLKLPTAVKRNWSVVKAYDMLLDYRCRSVKAYVFVATTGRSGSDSLARILSAAQNSVSLHEPHPQMYTDVPDGKSPRAHFYENFHKLKKIYIKRAAAGHSYYFETNHQFIKNFAELTFECFKDKVKVIHLVRNPVKVAISFYRIDSIPGKTSRGKRYLLDPDREDNIIRISDVLRSARFQHDLHKCFWYWYEIEARVWSCQRNDPGVPFYTLETDELNDETALLRMFNRLDIEVDHSKLKSLVGTRANDVAAKLHGESGKVIGLEEASAMHAELIRELNLRYGAEPWFKKVLWKDMAREENNSFPVH